MSVRIPTKVGDPIQLHLQLEDGNTALFVRAYLTDNTGAVFGTPIALSHVGEGLYLDNSVGMPAFDFVQATYVVFNDAGFTSESDLYGRSIDIFQRDELLPQQLPEGTDLEAVVASDETVVGEVVGVTSIIVPCEE